MIPILSVRGLTKVFGIPKREPITAVSNVTFDLAAGTALGVVGDSGCGKSTLVRLIMRLMPSTAGTILLKGHDITHLNERALREVYRTMQMVFQQPAASFDPRRTLGDGIGEPLRNQGCTRHEADRCAAELLERCGLTADMAARYPHEVSGGQCQRAAIARALAVSPELLICDEATSALDVTVAGQIMTLLKDLRRESGLSVLFISHSLELVQSFCDEMLVMNRGSIVESGTPDAVIADPQSDCAKRLAAGLRQTVSPIDAHSVSAKMGSESEESESSGFGGQRLGQDVVNLKTAEKFLLVGVTVRRHIELFSFHADFQNAAQPGAAAGHFEKCFLLIRHAHDDHGVERSLSGGFSSGAGASAAPIGVLVGILRGCELSCCRISARTEDDFWHTEPLFFCGETKV